MDKEKAIVDILEQQGWIRQFIASEPRLNEAVEMYKEAGFDVHLEPLPTSPIQLEEEKCQFDADCRQCFEGFEDQYRIIFTRPNKADTDGVEDDLF